MVRNQNPERLSLNEASKLRAQAGELLNRLIADREGSERRAAESGKRDPMKFITGRTALEAAIASTRDMIDQLDSLLAALRVDLAEAPASAAESTAHMTWQSSSRAMAKTLRRAVAVTLTS